MKRGVCRCVSVGGLGGTGGRGSGPIGLVTRRAPNCDAHEQCPPLPQLLYGFSVMAAEQAPEPRSRALVDCIFFSIPIPRPLTDPSPNLPQGGIAVSGGDDNDICVWDTQSGERVRTLVGHGQPVLALAMSEDGETVVSGSIDTTGAHVPVPIESQKGGPGRDLAFQSLPGGGTSTPRGPLGLLPGTRMPPQAIFWGHRWGFCRRMPHRILTLNAAPPISRVLTPFLSP